VATASTDNTVKLWDVKQGQCICSMEDHTDEVLDVCFNSTGSKLCSVSSDNTGRI
jgi:dynein assembly factor with WDR repeat domains 1